jgi:precorrin-2/cobalt-factor-2 C20-methyltransferase
MSEKKGKLYGIGVGPGDPELLTLKAARTLQKVAVIFCPEAKPGAGSHALQVVEGILDRDRQEVIPLYFPMKLEPSVLKAAWKDAVIRIHDVLSTGQDAAFITIGDTLLYSTFGNILDMLKEMYPDIVCEIIPGITSITASAAAVQVPLARSGERVLILPAVYRMDEFRAALEKNETVVLIKVNRVLNDVMKELREMGMADRAVLVSRCGTSEERIYYDLSALDVKEVDYLSTLIVTRKE